jgi:phage regulator Rha-like protein
MSDIIPVERIERKIYFIRRQKVMIDRDLAELYGVETRVLNQSVRRNIKRFPEDFMFHLSKEETDIWKSQIVITNKERMGLRRRPYAFTQEGIAMLSGVLNSERAIQVNIEIMRTFVKLRKMLASNAGLARKLKDLEKKYDERFAVVFEAIQALMDPPEKKKRKIGFSREKE